MAKVPKASFISVQYLHKSMDDEDDFLPADKHKSFLQGDSISYGVRTQACSKYPKQKAYNIFAINMSRQA